MKQDLKLRLSSTPSYTEPETLNLEPSLEEVQRTVQNLKTGFLEIHLLLALYESELYEHLEEVTSKDLTEDDFMYDQNTLH